jgi:hypothetical protein
MYYIQDACSAWAWLYFVALVVLGAMFALQLATAVLCVTYKRAEEQVEDEALQERAERRLLGGSPSQARGGACAGEGEGEGKGGQSARSSNADDLAGAGDQGGAWAGAGAGDVEIGGGCGVAAAAWQALRRSGGAAAGTWEGLRARCFSVQAAAWFQALSIAMVLANTLLLALWWSDMPSYM